MSVHIFSANMSWDCHVRHVLQKLAQMTGVIGWLRYLLPKGIKLLLYHSLFSSRLNYCQLVWGTTTVTNLNQVYLVQKKCVRHIFNAHFAASTNVLFCSSGIVKVHQIYNYTLSRKYKLETRKNITNLRVLANLGIRHLNYPT